MKTISGVKCFSLGRRRLRLTLVLPLFARLVAVFDLAARCLTVFDLVARAPRLVLLLAGNWLAS
jgi:hypothetical protein